ncbi:MAG: DUF4266 domain-containing protein [Polyangiaceae bacterium]
MAVRPPPVVALVLALFALASGCAHVPAYDRGKLAHPSMSTGDLTGVGAAHVYAVQEGAVGGGAGAGGGCGCN